MRLACAIVALFAFQTHAAVAQEIPVLTATAQPFSDREFPTLPAPLRQLQTFVSHDIVGSGARAEARPVRLGPASLALDAGLVRDLSGMRTAFAHASLALEIDDVRLASVLLAEKVFDPTRDEVDLHARASATVAITDELGVGVEYVAEDLEAVWEPEEADGGMRRFVGADLVLDPGSSWQVVGGPALALDANRSHLAGRVALDYRF